ncbi:MAG: SURF1 family protein [Gemmatimonadales bacterium]
MLRIVLFALTLLIGAASAGLGVWQLGRLAERRAANAGVAETRALPPIETEALGRVALEPNRRARVTGTYDEARGFVLRNRLVRGTPAVLIVTPLRLPGSDTALLVNRGYVPAANATRPVGASWSEPGERSVSGLLLPAPNRGDGAPVSVAGTRWETWQAIDLDAMRRRLPYPIHGLYLLALSEGHPGDPHTPDGGVYPIRADAPPVGDGPHLSYAIQWFGIGAAAVAFGIVFVLRRRHSRRPTV